MFSACLVFEDLVCLFQLRPGLIALTLIALAQGFQGFARNAECLSPVSTQLTLLTKMFQPPLTPG
jgi:hypothetical protein